MAIVERKKLVMQPKRSLKQGKSTHPSCGSLYEEVNVIECPPHTFSMTLNPGHHLGPAVQGGSMDRRP